MSKIESHEVLIKTKSNENYMNKTFNLNIRGIKFRVKQNILAKHPNTRLGELIGLKSNQEILQLCDEYNPNKNEYYFNRDPFVFNKILNYYVTDQLHIDNHQCVILIRNELNYWRISDDSMELCCRRLFDEQFKSVSLFLKHVKDFIYELNQIDDFGKKCLPILREKIWYLFEKPQSSIYAKVILYISLTLIFISMIELVMTTVTEFDDTKMSHLYCSNISHFFNLTNILDLQCDSIKKTISENHLNLTESELNTVKKCDSAYCEKKFTIIFTVFETIFTIWFTSELVIRFVCCPNKVKFLKSFMNILDLFCVITYLASNSIILHDSFKPLFALRLIRIFFIFKLSKHLESLKILLYTVKDCYRELLTLLVYLGISVLFFSCIIHYCEKDVGNHKFDSILDSFWWAFVTMTTVGYGDIVPFTFVGRLVTCICILISIVLLAMPVGIISLRFLEFQRLQLITHRIRDNSIKIKLNI